MLVQKENVYDRGYMSKENEYIEQKEKNNKNRKVKR